MSKTFSEREGYGDRPPITIRDNVPDTVRSEIIKGAGIAGMPDHVIREIAEKTLGVEIEIPPTVSGLREGALNRRRDIIVSQARWWMFLDLVEALYRGLPPAGRTGGGQEGYRQQVNRTFRAEGIGWELRDDGEVKRRGSKFYTKAVYDDPKRMREIGLETAPKEMEQAVRALSARPEPDLSGAIHHARTAMEVAGKLVSGDEYPFKGGGGKLGLTSPLGAAACKLYAFASAQGGHMREGQRIKENEAECLVTMAGALTLLLCELWASREQTKDSSEGPKGAEPG